MKSQSRSTPAHSQTRASADGRSSDAIAELREVVATVMSEHPVPGVVVAILAGGKQWIECFGVTNIDHPLPVNDHSLFQIGSVTKTFTATAIARLAERGDLSLDFPVRTYLPALRLADESVAAAVTLRHLLTHQGGWFGDLFDDTGMGDDALARYVDLLPGQEQQTPLGTIWAYNNSAFALAARVLEVVTGTTAEEAIRELVLQPLQMTGSFFFARDAITHRVAAGHFVYPEGPQVARPWYVPRGIHAVGGIITSATDLLRYAQFQVGNGTGPNGSSMLSPQWLAAMATRQCDGPLGQQQGLGWNLRELDGMTIVAHGGATSGQMAMLALIPREQFALAVLTNSGRGTFVHQAVARWAYRRYFDIAFPTPRPDPHARVDLAEFVGTYSSPGNTWEVRLADGSLVMEVHPKVALAKDYERRPPVPPPARAEPSGPDRVVIMEGPSQHNEGEFLRDRAGHIVWLRIGSRIHRRTSQPPPSER
jgi:CubicO group peptidase (beta-lactamase class C family)